MTDFALRGKAGLVFGLVVLSLSLPSYAERPILKEEDSLQLQRNLELAKAEGRSSLDVVAAALETDHLSIEARMLGLDALVDEEREGVEELLEEVSFPPSIQDARVRSHARRILAERRARSMPSTKMETTFLDQELGASLEHAYLQNYSWWLANELCDLGARDSIEKIEAIFSDLYSSDRLEHLLGICQEKIDLMASGDSHLETLSRVLATEDTRPGTPMHNWAIRSLLKTGGKEADSILIEYALQRKDDPLRWPRARDVVEKLQERGWSESELRDQGWDPTPPAVRSLRSRRAQSDQEDG